MLTDKGVQEYWQCSSIWLQATTYDRSMLPNTYVPCAAYFVQGVKMSLGTLTQSYYLKDDLLFDPPRVRGLCSILSLVFQINRGHSSA